MHRQLILASTSTYRHQLLQRLSLPFIAVPPQADEQAQPNESPRLAAWRLAQTKARSLENDYRDALIIGSDQVADLDGQAIGKPHTYERALAQLQAMRGRLVIFHTAVCLLNTATGNIQTASIGTRVTFLDLSDRELAAYLNKEPAFDCAGSAKVECLGIALLSKIESEDPTALIGLPLIALNAMLRNEGISPILATHAL